MGTLVFGYINISQGSVATHLRCDKIFNNHFIANFLLSATMKEFVKIGKYLAKMGQKVSCLVFL